MQTLVVIVKDKLITADTVVPVIREFKERCNGRILFYVPYSHTLEFIRKNHILFDAISDVADIKVIASRGGIGRKLEHLRTLFEFVLLAVTGAKFIHFGFLNESLYKYIGLYKPDNIYYMQNDTFYHNNHYLDILAKIRRKNQGIVKSDSDLKGFPVIVGSNIIVNNIQHSLCQSNQFDKKQTFIVDGSRHGLSWLTYIRTRESEFVKCHPQADITNGILVYVLSTFEDVGVLSDSASMESLFRKSLIILDELNINIPIFIKPHPVTQMEIVNDVLGDTKSKNIYITNLHPSLLALHAKGWLCNWYSTTCADAFRMGVPTIEFTEYSDSFLEETLGKSVGSDYMTHFIQNDAGLFRDLMLKIICSEKKLNKIQYAEDDRARLISSLCDL